MPTNGLAFYLLDTHDHRQNITTTTTATAICQFYAHQQIRKHIQPHNSFTQVTDWNQEATICAQFICSVGIKLMSVCYRYQTDSSTYVNPALTCDTSILTRVHPLLTCDMLSRILMIGSFFLKSQTTQLPACDDARMCCTCRFHAIQATSCAGCKHTHTHTHGDISSSTSTHTDTHTYTRRHQQQQQQLHTHTQTDRQTDKPTDTTKIMVTWP